MIELLFQISLSEGQDAFFSACFLILVILLSAFFLHKRYLSQLEWELSAALLSRNTRSSASWFRGSNQGVLSSIVPYFGARLRCFWEERASFEQVIQTISEIKVDGLTVSKLALQFCEALDRNVVAGTSFSLIARVSNGVVSHCYSSDVRADRIKKILPFLLTSSFTQDEIASSVELAANSFFHDVSSLSLDKFIVYRAEDFNEFGFVVILCLERDQRALLRFSRKSRENLFSYFCSRLTTALLREQQKHSLLLQRDCLLTLSHDMRAPAIHALSQIEEKASPIRKAPEEILRSTIRDQLAMVDCALAQYSRFTISPPKVSGNEIEKRKLRFAEYTWESASRLFTEVISELESNLKQRGLLLAVSKIPAVEISIPETFLRRILTNLLSNSLEANSKVKVNIQFELKKDFLQVEISDNGIGFAKKLPEVEASFPNKLEQSPSGGYGIGLRSVQQLVSYVGGEFTILPNTSGAAFELLLPSRPLQGLVLKRQELAQVSLAGHSLLLLEDDIRFSNSLAEFFRAKGMYVQQRSKYSSISELAEQFTPDIVVSDRYLADGDLFVNMKKNFYPGTPIVFLSTQTTFFSERKNIVFLEKPFSKKELGESVCRLLF